MAWSFILVCIPLRPSRCVYYDRNIGHFHGVVLVWHWANGGLSSSHSFAFHISRDTRALAQHCTVVGPAKKDSNICFKQSSKKSKHTMAL
jgi:hypothetical protein